MVRVNVILDHIRECCEDIFDFVRDMELEDFLSNKLVCNAVGMSLPQCQVMNWCQIIYLEAIRAIQYNK